MNTNIELTNQEQKTAVRKAVITAMIKELLLTQSIDLSTYHKMCKNINNIIKGQR